MTMGKCRDRQALSPEIGDRCGGLAAPFDRTLVKTDTRMRFDDTIHKSCSHLQKIPLHVRFNKILSIFSPRA